MAGASQGPRYKQMVFIICSRRLGLRPPLSDIYQSDNINPGSGVSELITEAKELEPFFESGDQLVEQYRAGEFVRIWHWCRNTIKKRDTNGVLGYLASAIKGHDLRGVNSTNTLAVLYFAYQILLA
jgi:hypothetical protein